MTLSSDPGFSRLLRRLEGQNLPSLDRYKERCLSRRLAVRMRACGVSTLSEYADLVGTIPGELDRLREAITINVTGFFRNPEVWAKVQTILDAEDSSRPTRRRAWSAGCATGEEAWTLAMVLAETAQRSGGALSRRFEVDATDLDEPSLEVARKGRYPVAAAKEAPPGVMARWTRKTEVGFQVSPRVREAVSFRSHDMSRDPAPGTDYDLVACRNVLIYFTRELQEELFAVFAAALRPGGLLVLGKVETLSGTSHGLFETVDGRERIFRRSRG
jgi:chemotaxis methyl-accepting protein methylase